MSQTSSSIHPAIPPVLDGVVAASIESSCDLGPSLAHLTDQFLDEATLLWTDWLMVQGRLEILMKALSALFGRTGSNQVRDADPIVRALALHELEKAGVFSWAPWSSLVWAHAGSDEDAVAQGLRGR